MTSKNGGVKRFSFSLRPKTTKSKTMKCIDLNIFSRRAIKVFFILFSSLVQSQRRFRKLEKVVPTALLTACSLRSVGGGNG